MFWGRLDQNFGVHGNRKPPLTYNGENSVCTFSRLLFIRSFLYLQVTRTCIKSQTSSKLGQIRPLTTELAALECLKISHRLIMEKWCLHAAHSFLIESSSKLLVTRTGIKAWSNSILDRIRPLILELLALERRKFHTFELEYLWSQLANLDHILCVASLGWGNGCIRFWGRLDQNSGFHGNLKPPLTYKGENDVSIFSRFLRRTCIKLDEFEFRPDRTTDYRVSCPRGLKNFP